MTGPSPRALLLDVEGTTTAISFVTDVLFPFARERMEGVFELSVPLVVDLGSGANWREAH